MHLVLLAFKSKLEDTEGVLYDIEPRLVCQHSVLRKARCIQNGVVCVKVDQGITSSKNDIVDIYREKSRPEN